MKKIVVMLLLMFIVIGCGNDENRLLKDNYLDNHSYQEVYNELSRISQDVSYIPTKENEREFYEMIEVIKEGYNKFSKDELENLYNLINNNYEFKYNLDRYDNDSYHNDLNTIKGYITE